ncbi:MAG: queuosine precursor transporter [Chloroflexi bacterium]|nr:queuosine precursor transporter [Chloroflexota bacterium]
MRFTGTFVVVVALFITVLIVSNIIAVRTITILPIENLFSIQWFGDPAIILPASIIIFPISYIVGDVLTEVYGFRIARGVIWLGFAMNLLVVIALWVAGIIPGAFFWGESDQASYDRILGQVPGILVASFIAYLVGEFSNSTVLALLKYKMQGRLLFVRTIGSTIVGQGLDSFIFIFIAFGVFSDWSGTALLGAALAQWIVKILYESAATPLTYLVVNFMKRKEEMDVTDVPRSLNPLGIFT